MGLAEKRIVKAYQEGPYKTLVSEINALAGFEPEFEIDWNSLSNNSYSHIWENSFTEIYFAPIINAFKAITEDDIGKEALQETLKKIIIKDENDNAYANSAYSFQNGILIINHNSYTNVDNASERTEVLTKLLENQL